MVITSFLYYLQSFPPLLGSSSRVFGDFGALLARRVRRRGRGFDAEGQLCLVSDLCHRGPQIRHLVLHRGPVRQLRKEKKKKDL